ncbi:MAG: ABC transporter transmembrane domain-containing protein [Woeseiaceae bacterium]|nr:ABC transporter transmembrane domain-containing protein [Woeseiaceae bacterium]
MSETAARDRPKAASIRPLKALWPFIEPYRGTLAFALLALLLAAVALLALPVALRYVIDQGFGNADLETINRYFAAFFVVAALFGLFSALRYYLVTWLGERVVADLRSAVYARVIRMDATFFEVTRTGEVLSRLTTDTTLVQSIAGVGLSIALRSSLNVVGGVVMLAWTSPGLTAIILVSIPAIIAPLIAVGRRIRHLSMDAQARIADSSSIADETLNAVQTVQAYTLEPTLTQRFGDSIRESFRAAIRRIRARASPTALGTLLIFSTVTLVLWLGARGVIAGNMSGGELAQFLTFAVIVGGSGAALSELWGEIQRAAGAMERLAELLAMESSIDVGVEIVPLPSPCRGAIRFDGVTFCYPSRPGNPSLDDVTLEVDAGETLALVGPSGAGKSTMFQLLLRFYDPQRGRVLVDDTDLRGVEPAALRRRIGLVPQDTVLFGASAMENIRYGNPEATDEAVVAAATAAEADEFIRGLPEGYATFLGERGLRLSGGQRQRIAIARAILKDPPDPPARRGNEFTRCGKRAARPAGAGTPDAGPYDDRHRASPCDGAGRRPDRRHGPGTYHCQRYPRCSCAG